MWLYTKIGFFSVTRRTDMKDHLQIRARRREHLERLIKQLGKFRDKYANIIETDDSDYRYRIIVSKGIWTYLASALTSEIDYPNFKAAAPPEMTEVLHEVWAVTAQLDDGGTKQPA